MLGVSGDARHRQIVPRGLIAGVKERERGARVKRAGRADHRLRVAHSSLALVCR
jgi:hypothetical protein